MSLRDSQMAMANFLRNPEDIEPPAGVEARRLKIYQDLIYNNIEYEMKVCRSSTSQQLKITSTNSKVFFQIGKG